MAATTGLERNLKRAIAGQVVRVFNDPKRGERPVQRQADGLFGPQTVAWRVHGDVTSMLVGGVCSLLLQMLHPAVLAGVWDHSNFRADMHGRLRRTARFIAVTTYGSRADAEASIARVRRIHDAVRGTLPDGTPYHAADPHLLAWVHATETWSFLAGWRRYGDPGMSDADADRYVAEVARVGEALGADPLPYDRRSLDALIHSMRGELLVDERVEVVRRLVLEQRATTGVGEPVQRLAMAAGVDLLPAWARAMHGLSPAPLARPLTRLGTLGLARTLRWAFA